jgi:HEAT repeats
MRNKLLLWVLLGTLAVAAGRAAPQQPGGEMTPSQVAEHVKQKDWNIAERPGIVGADAGPELERLLNDPDPQVRQLAVTCLNQAGGASAKEGLLIALHDRTDTVRAAAARFLQNHFAAADVPVLEHALSQSRDEFVREQIALLLGKVSADAPFLRGNMAKEPDEHARHAMSLALARLGDPGQRHELLQRLGQDQPAERVGALRDLPYVNDRALLVYLVPLLDDMRPGLNVGPSHGPFLLRVCDVAVNIANEMLGRPFPWVQPVKRYSAAELQQVKGVLAGVR